MRLFFWGKWVTIFNHFPAETSLLWQQVICTGNQIAWLISYKKHFLSPISQSCFGCWLYSALIEGVVVFLGCTGLIGVCRVRGACVPHTHSLDGHCAFATVYRNAGCWGESEMLCSCLRGFGHVKAYGWGSAVNSCKDDSARGDSMTPEGTGQGESAHVVRGSLRSSRKPQVATLLQVSPAPSRDCGNQRLEWECHLWYSHWSGNWIFWQSSSFRVLSFCTKMVHFFSRVRMMEQDCWAGR